jgi:hypothetical protein
MRIRSTDIYAFSVSYFTVLFSQATFNNELMTLLNIRRRHERVSMDRTCTFET